ncbi:hypothetical protein KUV51_20395 [Tateyamaria omphalii]|uniref:hypothetical protein n=1 Tax=Tateyamaria omphalii TaxID=299262 RepID=UPI001C98EEC9|nr:hypothetical protein [Tateyamaria omphalii]MBY5935378.1 hypothetical protein [Tateyamaria omphalii]
MLRALSFILACAPMPALALSCMQYGVTDAYQEAAAAEEGYVPVLGKLEFDADLLPEMDLSGQTPTQEVTLIPATFKGDALTMRGIDQPFETDVVLEVQCFGPWCPQPQPGEMLGFLRQTEHSYVLHTNACGGFLFGRPDDAQVAQVRDCLAGRKCEPLGPR